MQYYEEHDPQFIARGSGVLRSTDRPHVTQIIRGVLKELGRTKHAEGWDMAIAAEVGFLWEDIVSHFFAERMVHRPGEIELDGIVLSPDGLCPDPGFGDLELFPPNPNKLVVEEYKATWRSMKRKPTDDLYWMCQAKAYCYVLGLDMIDYHILYIMGDYRGSGPQYRTARIVYSQEELVNNWAMILENKERHGGKKEGS